MTTMRTSQEEIVKIGYSTIESEYVFQMCFGVLELIV